MIESIKIAICDDSLFTVNSLAKIIEQHNTKYLYYVDTYTIGGELSEAVLHNDKKYDAIFMDVDLGDDMGIDIAAKIRELYPEILIIYITLHDDYYLTLLNAEPFGFLEKPLKKDRVFEILEKVEKRLHAKDFYKVYYSFSFAGQEKQVNLNDILYIMSYYRKIILKHKDGTDYEFYGKLVKVYDEIEKIYPYFVQINKSTLVNIRKVEFEKKNQILIGGEVLIISKPYFNEYNYSKMIIMK